MRKMCVMWWRIQSDTVLNDLSHETGFGPIDFTELSKTGYRRKTKLVREDFLKVQ
jgi:hypothetical protein